MKHKRIWGILLTFIVALAFIPAANMRTLAATVSIDEDNFPDEHFRNYVSENYDTNNSGSLSDDEIAAVTKMTYANKETTTMKGIEVFTSLEELKLSDSFDEMLDLKSLDLSGNTSLKKLTITCAAIETLDLSHNMELEYVALNAVPVKSLDMTGHSALKGLYCDGIHGANEVILNGCSNLKNLDVYWTHFWGTKEKNFKKLDISSCPLIVDIFENGTYSEETAGWVKSGDDPEGIYYPKFRVFKGEKGYFRVDFDIEIIYEAPEQPVIAKQPADVTVKAGQNAAFEMEAYGADSYQWQESKDGTSWLDYPGAVTSTLTFKAEASLDGRQYRCVASNASGSVVSNAATLTVSVEEVVVVTGWQEVGGKWLYYGSDGKPVTGWQKLGKKWYLFNSAGVMLTGWQKSGGKWYYFAGSGAMVTGWKKIGGKWYFFKAGGAMAAKEWCKGYWLNANGTWTYKAKASWKKNSKGWYFKDTSGWFANNQTLTIDGKKYKFNAAGYCENP